MSATIKQVISFLETIAPPHLTEDWDNTGLAIGDANRPVKKILLALDVIDEVVEEAIANKVDLIVTHHPMLLFRKIERITTANPIGRRILSLIEHKIAAYSAHTNLDSAEGGINDILADQLQLVAREILEPTYHEVLQKLVVYVPLTHLAAVRDAMCEAGAGHIGQYKDCTFASEGIGTFVPLAGTNAFLGEVDKRAQVQEARLESIVPKTKMGALLAAVKQAHPYEEMAYDIYAVEQTGAVGGLGRVGDLKEAIPFSTFATQVKQSLGLKELRVVGDADRMIQRIAICSGSGMSLAAAAAQAKADVYVTADIKYHEAQSAQEKNLCLIDATHYASEVVVLPYLANALTHWAKQEGFALEILQSKIDGQTFWSV